MQQISKPNPFLVLFGAVGGAWALFLQFGSLMIALTAIWIVLSTKTKVVTEKLVRSLTMSATQGKVSPLQQQDLQEEADESAYGSDAGSAQTTPSVKPAVSQDSTRQEALIRRAEVSEKAPSAAQMIESAGGIKVVSAPLLQQPSASPRMSPKPNAAAAPVPGPEGAPMGSSEAVARPSQQHEALSAALTGLAGDLVAQAELLKSDSGLAAHAASAPADGGSIIPIPSSATEEAKTL